MELPSIQQCLPPQLQRPGTVISRIEAGLSGARVYRVESPSGAFVLKLAASTENADDWGRALQIQRLAAESGLAPPVIHVDDARRAVVTTLVTDSGFPRYYRSPQTHQAAVASLGRTVRRLHAIPIPARMPRRYARQFLVGVWKDLQASLVLPGFAVDAVVAALAQEPPAAEGAPVLSHNDLNPSNLVYDGQSILILDWATAAPNEPFYDLAVLAVFLRMDERTCLRLLSAYEGEQEPTPGARVPARFTYNRRLVAALAGTMSLSLAQKVGHPGASGAETSANTLSLGDFYQRMLAGELKLGTADGQWAFGLTLLKETLEQ